MGVGSWFQEKVMRPSKKMGRQVEDYVKTTYMGDPNGIEGLRQKRQSGTDLGKLRADALANGFNPLTVLRATGGQGFYHDQVPMGRLSSDAFFNAFDAYESYQNKNTSDDEINERSHFDIPLMITVFDESGNVEDFKIINPELIEMSGQEITGSLGMLAAQYAAQHKVSIAKAKEILKNIIDNRRKNIGLEPVFPKTPSLETNAINKQSSAIDRFTHGLTTGNWIFPESKPNYNQKISGVPIDQQQRVLDSM
jgi:hypothetical protein